MSMKKVGICTLYYNNINYGGNLQAYALQKVVSSLGYEAELICYSSVNRSHLVLSSLKRSLLSISLLPIKLYKRNSMLKNFRKGIPHSRVFYPKSINKANKEYDIFIAGSDQVWNPDWINEFLSLDFVDKTKLTISYAASTGKIKLSVGQKEKIKRALDNTKYVSIREKESIPPLNEITTKRVEYVLDPTMLLDKEDWNSICTKRIVDEDYLFCYFLGDNAYIREIAKEYAKYRNLKLVSIPYLNGSYRAVDDGFGDYSLYQVSPNDLLSLIKYSSFVMTDSFHVTTFSHLFESEFIVSIKQGSEMGCRMKSITELFGTEDRFITAHEQVTIDTMNMMEQSTLKFKWNSYEDMRKKSLLFLKEALNSEC